MSIVTTKEVSVTINGDDFRTLTDVCEMARLFIAANTDAPHQLVAHWSFEDKHRIEQFSEKIWEA